MDIWLQALKSSIFIVGSYRHPSAVAQSLAARDGIPLEIGYALWGVYIQHLIHHMRKHPYALVRFDVEQEQLLKQVANVCNRTGLRADKDTISSWYDSKLVRSATMVNDNSPMFKRIEPLWNELVSLHADSERQP